MSGYFGHFYGNNQGGGGAGTPPLAPTISLVSVGDGQVTIAYVAPTLNYSSGLLEYADSSGVTGHITVTTSGNYTVTGLNNGETYIFFAVAKNSLGTYGPISNVLTTTPISTTTTTAFNANWARWIRASSYKYFKENLDPSVAVYMEGENRKTTDLSSYVEYRIDGPKFTEITSYNWMIDIQVNVAVMVDFDRNDLYKIDKWLGFVVAAMPTAYPIYQLGDAPLVQVGCMQRELKSGTRGIRTFRFGNVDPKVKMSVLQVETDFRMSLP